MTRDEMRTLVRDILEVDNTELTDVVIDAFLEEGRDKIVSRQGDWPFLQIQVQFSTVINQRAYDLSTIGGAGTVIKDISTLLDENGTQQTQLWYVDHNDLASVWHGSTDHAGQPRWWSLWEGSVHLWPKPDAIHTITLIGWRDVNDWPLSTDTPDIPTKLHRAICWWALSAWYHKEEDSAMAQLYEQRFERDVDAFAKDLQRTPQAQPLIWCGGVPRFNELSWLQSNVDH